MFLFFLSLFKPLPSPQLVNTGTIQIGKRVRNFISRRWAVRVRCCLLRVVGGRSLISTTAMALLAKTVLQVKTKVAYLLLRREPRIIKLSSIKDTMSDVSAPLRSNSPRFLKFEKENTCVLHSDTTPFNLKSMSRSLTAAMQTSCRK